MLPEASNASGPIYAWKINTALEPNSPGFFSDVTRQILGQHQLKTKTQATQEVWFWVPRPPAGIGSELAYFVSPVFNLIR